MEIQLTCPFVNLPETRRSRFGEELNAEKMKKAICQRARWRSRVGLSKIGGAWIRLAFYETIRFKPGGVLMRSIVFLGMTLLAASVGIGQNHPRSEEHTSEL